MNTLKSVNYQFQAWKEIGYIPPKQGLRRISYILLSVILNSLTILNTFLTILNTFYVNDLHSFCESMYYSTTLVCVELNFLSALYHRKTQTKIWSVTEYLDKRIVSKEEQDIFTDDISYVRNIFFSLRMFLFISLGVLELATIVLALTKHYKMILPIWLPFEAESNKFWIANSLQFFCIIMAIFKEIIAIMFAPVQISIFVGHMNVLSNKIKNIGCNTNNTTQESLRELYNVIEDHQHVLN